MSATSGHDPTKAKKLLRRFSTSAFRGSRSTPPSGVHDPSGFGQSAEDAGGLDRGLSKRGGDPPADPRRSAEGVWRGLLPCRYNAPDFESSGCYLAARYSASSAF